MIRESSIRLAGEETIDSLRFEPALFKGGMLHFLEAGIELGFEFFPFRAMGVLGAPGKAVEFVDVKKLENELQAAWSGQLSGRN